MSYCPQTYGPTRSSAVFNMVSVYRSIKGTFFSVHLMTDGLLSLTQQMLPEITSENSNAALSTNSFSDQTLDLGPISLSARAQALLTCCR